MEVGAHTIQHPILNSVSDAEALHEIAESKRQLEAVLGTTLVSFAYPNGRPGTDYSPRHVEMTRAAGFSFAASTAVGCIGPASDMWQLPRIAPWPMSVRALHARLAWWYREPQTNHAAATA
jgi:peptidoglycan/xylan/chitin deacetylase (PgdA/CDA1 family)